jgi:hypothetical protein
MADLDSLEADLRALGRTLVVEPPAEDLTERVLAALPPTRRRRSPWAWLLARRRRIVAVIIAVVIVGLGLTPPVRAAVIEWLRIGGIMIRTSPPVSGPSPTPQPPPRSDPTASLVEAQARVNFPIGVPDALGAPDRIAVSADRRVVSMDVRASGMPYTIVLFAALDEDPRDALDGVRDPANMPVEDEPQRIRDDLDAFTAEPSAASPARG